MWLCSLPCPLHPGGFWLCSLSCRVHPWGFWLCSLSCPLHPRVSGYVHCHVVYILGVSGYVHCLACYTPGLLVMSSIMPATLHGFLLCSPSDHVLYNPRFLVRCIVLHFYWTSLFTPVFLVMAHFCACTPTVQYCTGEGFSHQGDTAADLRLLLSSCWIRSSCVLLPAPVNETLGWFNQSRGE